MYTRRFLLFLTAYSISFSNAIVYKSCSEALVKEKTSQIYDIQPFYRGNISRIYCQIVNDTIGLSTLDHNAENLTYVKGYELAYAYKFEMIYENFNEKDVDAYLETITECSQGMKYNPTESSSDDHQIIFWDNLKINPNGAPDGICRCFISYNCLLNSDPSLNCLNTGYGTTNDEGLFSVKSSRLPIKAVYFGDTDSSGEYLYYKVWKLKCEFKLMTVTLKVPRFSSNCLLKNLSSIQYKLMDGKNETCIKYNSNFVYLEIEMVKKIREIEIIGKNLEEQNVNFFLLGKNKEVCVEKEKMKFECEASDFINFQAFSPETSIIELCELQISS